MNEEPIHARLHSNRAFGHSDFWTRIDDFIADSLVGSVMVIPIDVRCQGLAQRRVADTPDMVGELFLNTSDDPFAMGVHIRGTRGSDVYGHVCGGDDPVESGVFEDAVTVVQQMGDAPLFQNSAIHDQGSSDVGHDGAVRVLGDSGDMDATGGEVDDDQDIDGTQSREGDHRGSEEITGGELTPVQRTESFPVLGSPGAFACGRDVVALQNVGDGRFGERGSVHQQHAEDFSIAPGGAAPGDDADETFDPASRSRSPRFPDDSSRSRLSTLDDIPEPLTYGAECSNQYGIGGFAPAKRFGGDSDVTSFVVGERQRPGAKHATQDAQDGDELQAQQGVLGAQRGFTGSWTEEGKHGARQSVNAGPRGKSRSSRRAWWRLASLVANGGGNHRRVVIA